uniref:ATP synthase F0 subunit 6 n=1 Tax=Dixoniella grisea TaxID=35153 RepID=UPI001FCD5B36|nr:ATP synthase F0 subunit 6 [Dixoniella grisea]UNJ18996.1 ATP synthase F0 subunit 6 [Dixoniella grisea]
MNLETSTFNLLCTSPLEQFEILPLVPFFIFGINITFTNSTLFLVVSFFLIFTFLQFIIYQIRIIPNNWQLIGEFLYSLVSNIIKENIGNKGEIYFPFIFVIFLLVLSTNLIGMIPYTFTVTSHIIFTFSLAFILFTGINLIGILLHNFNFLNVFLPKNTPIFIIPLLIVIEIISYITKVFTLSIRLFANLTSGHALLKIIAGFSWTMLSITGVFAIFAIIPLLLLILLIGLELGIAFLQAYVFALLSCIYLNDVLNMH